MAINYDAIIEHGILNNVGTDYHMYYHKKRECFLVRNRVPANSRFFVETPYLETCKSFAWEHFWSALTEEEYALANSFDEKHGFFAFMRETGLISVFDAAMEQATVEVFESWASDNSLNIDWDNIVID